MDLSLTKDQEMLKSTAREFIQRECPKDLLLAMDQGDVSYDAELRRKMADLGWLGITIPEEYGGEGQSLFDAGVLFQELGRGPVPGPYFSSSILGAMILLEGATPEQKAQILPEIARGSRTLVIAVTEGEGRWEPSRVQMTATPGKGTYRLDGVKLFVQDALGASSFICAVRTPDSGASGASTPGDGDNVSLMMVDANSSGILVRDLPGFNSSLAEIRFDGVEVPASQMIGPPGGGWEILEAATGRAIPVLCAYYVGGCEAVYEMSVSYSQTRIQFGQPIGRFQRVQDHIIDQVNHLDAARWTTYEALWKLDSGKPTDGAVHLAKAVSAEAYYQACNRAHEVHAGVGVMTEYGLTLHTKMSRSLYHFLGDPRYHKRRLAQELGL